MRPSLLLRVVLVLVLLAGGVFAGLYFTRPVVAVAPVRLGTAAASVPGTVTVRAERTYIVVTEVPGRIIRNDLKVGQKVGAGDLLVQIDRKAVDLDIRQLKGRLESINTRINVGSTKKFELEGAQDGLKYQEDLLSKNATSPAAVEAARRAVRSLEQAIELEAAQLQLERSLLEASLDAQQTLLEKTELRSPIDGIVSRVEAFVGDLVGGHTLIAEIVSLTRIVDMKVSEENNAFVQIGQVATVRLASYGGRKFSAEVAKLATTADPETQRYVVELVVDAPPEELVPGMTGEAVITVATRPNALLIPRPALIGDQVYVVTDGVVERRTVTVGFSALNEAEILEGVAKDEWVAISMLDRLNDGSRVRTEMAK